MTTILPTAIDSQLSHEDFDIARKISDIASDFGARGFTQPNGSMCKAVDELCISRMEKITETAIETYKRLAAQGIDKSNLKNDLSAYLKAHLNSIKSLALQSYERSAGQSSQEIMDSKVRSLLAAADSA